MASFNKDATLVNVYFTTNTNNPTNPSGVASLPNADGRFNQDFTAVQTTLTQRVGQQFDAHFTASRTFFIQKELLEGTQGSYEVWISYVDGNGDTYSVPYAPPNPIILPWRSNLNSFTPVSLHKNGDIGQPALYEIVQSTYSTYSVYLKPITTVVTNQVPVQINVNINAFLAVRPGQTQATLSKYFLTGYSINNSVFLPSTVVPIEVVFPYWTRWPYWAQTIIATENQAVSKYAPALGGFPSVVVPMKQFLFQNDQAILNTDGGAPTGTPSCFLQIELSVLDVSYIGNQSTGQILTTVVFSPIVPNEYTFTVSPQFYEETRQAATNMSGQSQIQFGITDRFGNPFLSLLAAYDITTGAILEATRRQIT